MSGKGKKKVNTLWRVIATFLYKDGFLVVLLCFGVSFLAQTAIALRAGGSQMAHRIIRGAFFQSVLGVVLCEYLMMSAQALAMQWQTKGQLWKDILFLSVFILIGVVYAAALALLHFVEWTAAEDGGRNASGPTVMVSQTNSLLDLSFSQAEAVPSHKSTGLD